LRLGLAQKRKEDEFALVVVHRFAAAARLTKPASAPSVVVREAWIKRWISAAISMRMAASSGLVGGHSPYLSAQAEGTFVRSFDEEWRVSLNSRDESRTSF